MIKPTISQKPLGVDGSKALKPDEFGVMLGLASWLMSLSEEHKSLPISSLDDRILPGILLKQFRLIRKDMMPVAFITWASVSDELKARFDSGDPPTLKLEEWRSGKRMVIVDCVSPFAPTAKVKQQFIAEFLKTAANRATK